MRTAALLLLLALCTGTTAAQPLVAFDADCGGDAVSSAEVIEHRPPRRGPIRARPGTLCADIAKRPTPVQVDLYDSPLLLPQNGGGRRPAPYEAWPHAGGPPQRSSP